MLSNSTRQPSVRLIAEVVAEHCGISYTDLISERRHRDLVRARTIAAGLARRLTTRSYPRIAGVLGDRDHTTIIHSVRRFDEMLESEPGVVEEVAEIEEVIAVVGAVCREMQWSPPSDPDLIIVDEIVERVVGANGRIDLAPYELMALVEAAIRSDPEAEPTIDEGATDAGRELLEALAAVDSAIYDNRGGVMLARKRVDAARAALADLLPISDPAKSTEEAIA